MTTAIFSDGRPMSEAEFLDIGETPERIELFDGSLHVTPATTPQHQRISRRLANALDPGANAIGLEVWEAINVRLQPNRVPIPDIVITSGIDEENPVVDAADVHLVCEITSPSNASVDKVLKMHYYATGGIRWYLLVDVRARSLHLHRLVDGTYVEHAASKAGEILPLTEPVVATLDPAALLPPR
jgi:Uma2 family endonuclease